MTLEYFPDFFKVDSLEEAKIVILTPGGTGMTHTQRWAVETRWLVDRIHFDDDGLVIDYGCGIGRLARELKNPVLGVDISRTMRIGAENYVCRDTFGSVTPQMLKIMSDCGLVASAAVVVWTLQHILDVEDAVSLLAKVVKPGGIMWVLDSFDRSVPHRSPEKNMPIFVDDKISVAPLLDKSYVVESCDVLKIYPKSVELRKYRRRR